ncbi:MAG: carboxymuconolactone decarboxylase family protein [Candidatus Methanomethylicaceae archaeon]
MSSPLKIFEELDPELLKRLESNRDFAFGEGALPRKYKLLIAMTLDASLGAADGVRSLAMGAMQAGATREEVLEALRVAQYICGVSTVYVAARALEPLFQHPPNRS